MKFWPAPPSRPRLALDLGRGGDSGRQPLAAWTALGVATLLLAGAALHYGRLRAAEDDTRAELEALQARTASARPAPGSTPRGDPRQASELKAIDAQLAYPWVRFFETLETQRNPDVALLAVVPDRRTGLMRISAEAKDLATMLGFLAGLQRSPAFDGVVLSSHEVQDKRPGSPMRFELQGRWRLDAGPDALASDTTAPLPPRRTASGSLQPVMFPQPAGVTAQRVPRNAPAPR